MIKIIFSLLLCVNFCAVVFAEESLKLSGVMNGSTPTAIINDKIVAAGDIIDGYRIVEIGVGHVICQGKGGTINLYLKESTAPQNKTKTAPVAKPAAPKSAIPS